MDRQHLELHAACSRRTIARNRRHGVPFHCVVLTWETDGRRTADVLPLLRRRGPDQPAARPLLALRRPLRQGPLHDGLGRREPGSVPQLPRPQSRRIHRKTPGIRIPTETPPRAAGRQLSKGPLMNKQPSLLTGSPLTRRDFLCRSGMGFASLGLRRTDGVARAGSALRGGRRRRRRWRPRAALAGQGQARHPPVHERRPVARRYVRSQADRWQSTPASCCRATNLRTERKTGAAFPSPFKFQKYGKSGIEVSELFAHTARCIDDICVIRSMHADVPNHEPSLLLMNCGEARLIRPSMGSWVTYGLGSDNQNLPGFIAMCPGGYPIQETQNWQSAFLPGAYQGTYIDTRHTRDRQAHREHQEHVAVAARAAPPAGSAAAAQRTASAAPPAATPSWKRASSRSSWPTGCRWTPATPST